MREVSPNGVSWMIERPGLDPSHEQDTAVLSSTQRQDRSPIGVLGHLP